MKFRTGAPDDAEAIADLIASFQTELTDDPSGAGAEAYLATVSVAAERQYLESGRYNYIVAVDGTELVGVIACRDRSHIFHLFVARTHQRRGVARHLWNLVLRTQASAPGPDRFTVNSSLGAVPAYRAFGFVSSGVVTQVHGISFLPMQLSGAPG
jgi:ribosomal protein S18 acetylase RimI-like enzyme